MSGDKMDEILKYNRDFHSKKSVLSWLGMHV